MLAAMQLPASLRAGSGSCILPRAAVQSPAPKCVRASRSIVAHAAADGQRAPAVAAGIAAGLLLLSGAPAHANTAVYEGPARVVDGDTLYIGSAKIRLYGVDAPEKAQMCSNSSGQPYACGVASLEALKQRVGNRAVRCEVKNLDQYGRNVAACSISPDLPFQQPEDIGNFLVSNGYAVAYRAYGKEYIPLEDQAQSNRKGIWQGSFTEPALWRKQQKAAALNASLASASLSSMDGLPGSSIAGIGPLPQQQPAAAALPFGGSSSSSVGAGAPGGKPSYAAVVAAGTAAGSQQQQQQLALAGLKCNGPLIKGNINSKGQKIYHTQTSGQYMRVIIEESKGERFFCTEEEAMAAGWVAAKK